MQTKSFFIITISTLMFYGCSRNKAEIKQIENKHYIVAIAYKASLQQTVKLPAQLAAYEEVSIFPKVNGYIKSVLVDIGSHVDEGEILMTLEAPELEQAVAQAKEKYERVQSDYVVEKENYDRLKEASRTSGAVSPLDIATAQGKADADSALSNAEKSNWQMQQTMMEYLIVKAPFKGVITERNIHPGALVSAEAKDAMPMLELKEIDKLRLQVDIPERIAAGLKKGQAIDFYLSAFPGKKMRASISRKSNNINIQYRTERVELDVANPDGELSPGMYADVLIESQGNANALVIPKSAVITSTERKYVFVVRNGKAKKVDVSTGNETTDNIEITGDLKPGEEVITNATDEMQEGETIK